MAFEHEKFEENWKQCPIDEYFGKKGWGEERVTSKLDAEKENIVDEVVKDLKPVTEKIQEGMEGIQVGIGTLQSGQGS